MLNNRISAAALLLTLVLAGCSWDEDVVPAMTGESAGEATAAMPASQLPHGGVTQFEPTGTAAGEVAASLRTSLAALQSDIDSEYAKAEEARASAAVGPMQDASGSFAAAGERATSLLSQTRDAYNLDGVTDEDRHQLSVLEGEVSRTASVIDQVRQDLDTQIAATSGVSSGAVAPMAATGDMPIAGPVLPAPELGAGAKPFVVIRFDQPDVAYQSQLATAINQAMQRRPNAFYDLVAVSPTVGSPSDVRRNTRAAQKSAREVLEYLTSVGVAPERVTLSATTNAAAATNEVQIYVR